MAKYKYFTDREFRSAHPSCNLSDMDPAFMDLLVQAREKAGIPFLVNSAYRSPEYEREKGRSGSSSHTKGLAIDLSCKTASNRLKMVLALLSVGFRRIGLYSTFIHVDMDSSKPACIWLGK